MYKKLEEETIDDILEAGIDEFIEKGLQGAAMSGIAKKSGVSVGVIYKYFTDKNTFFLQCLDHSLELLSNVLQEAKDLRGCIRKIVAALISNSKIHSNYNAMYNEIMSGSCRKYAKDLVGRIEGRSAEVYRTLIEQAQKEWDYKTS